MDKKIPIFFDEAIIIDSPIQEIVNTKESTISRLKVGAFYKYKNRNGSYISDEYAELLIKSATRGNVPVVGFFDPGEQTWASHTGPTLANGYGYIESFLGWEPLTDTDGVTRDYAVFSVILFTDYYEEARKVIGQNQSMELDPNTIEGDWARFDQEEYFVYTKGDMASFCIIGAHEPCFSVSSFFSKNDDIKSRYEKFSSLLSNLKIVVEEAEKNDKGGEQPMNELENQEVVEQVENPQVQEEEATFSAAVIEPEAIKEEIAQEFEQQEEEVAEEGQIEEINNEPSEFDVLQNQFNELQTTYNALQAKVAELEQFQTSANEELTTLRAENEQLKASIATYEAQNENLENARKTQLVEKYEKILDAEEITPIRDSIKDFSYDELESKLAIQFANQQMTVTPEKKKVPLVEQKDNSFATLMSKYRKN